MTSLHSAYSEVHPSGGKAGPKSFLRGFVGNQSCKAHDGPLEGRLCSMPQTQHSCTTLDATTEWVHLLYALVPGFLSARDRLIGDL